MAPYDGIKVDSRTPWREITENMDYLGLNVDAVIYHCVLQDDRAFCGASNKIDVFLNAPEFARERIARYVLALSLAVIDLDLLWDDDQMREQIKSAKAAIGDKFAERVSLALGAFAAAFESQHGGLLATPAINGVQAFAGGTSSFDGVRLGVRSGSDAGDGKGAGVEVLGGLRVYSEPRLPRFD